MLRAFVWVSMTLMLLVISASAYEVQLKDSDLIIKNVNLSGFLGDRRVELSGGYALPTNPGEPGLPALSVVVALPPGMAIESVDISSAEPEILPGYYHLFPTQTPTPVGSETTKYVVADPTVYSSASPFPGNLVHSFASGNMSGYSIGNILLAPVQYIPASGQLVLYKNIRFTVNLKPAGMDYVYPQRRFFWVDKQLRDDISSMVINPDEITSPPTAILNENDPNPEDMYAYLIIAANDLGTSANALANWETRKGRKAQVFDLTYVAAHYTGVDIQEQIRNCIKDYYQTHGTQFVCLIGTGGILPMRKCYDAGFDVIEGDHMVPTDNYYGCLDGTWNADGDGYWGESNDDVDYLYDVYVGRIQVANTTWLEKVIDKTMCYEGSHSATETNPYNYQQNAIMAGGWLDASTNEMELMTQIEGSSLTSPFYAFTNLWDTTYPGGSVFNATNFVNQMNTGPGIIAHASHSNTTILGTNSGNVSSSQLYALSNHPKFAGLFYTLGCYDANVDSASNCAAYFVAAPSGGGVNFVGNTRYGWYSPGSPAAGYNADFEKSYFQYFATNNEFISGRTLALHKVPFVSYTGDATYRYIYYEIYLTGDPDTWVPNGTIGTMNVAYTAQIGGGQQNYTVHVGDTTGNSLANAMVCVWKGTEVYGSGTSGLNGDITFSINPASSGTMLLTVTGQNYQTFEANVTVNCVGVNLISFTSQRTSRGAQLQWQVADPGSINYFNLYRRSLQNDSESISRSASLTKAGNSSISLNSGNTSNWVKVNQNPIIGRNPFTFTDSSVGKGKFEYTLEAVLDSKPQGLGSTILPQGNPISFSLAVKPNPVTSVAYVTVNLASAEQTKLSLFDLSGRTVRQIVNAPMPAGTNSFSVDVSSLAKGIYIMQLSSGGNTTTKRFVVTH